jgi:hypothetical protein
MKFPAGHEDWICAVAYIVKVLLLMLNTIEYYVFYIASIVMICSTSLDVSGSFWSRIESCSSF